MKKLSILLIIVSLFVLNNSAVQARPAPDGFADLVEKLLPTVVNISTSQTVEHSIGGSGGVQIFPEFPPEAFPPGHPFEQFRDFFDQFNGNGNGDGDNVMKEKLTSLGSGFIISESGLVVTNYHVIANAEEITVTLHDESQYEAEVIGHDAKTDLAVLKIKHKGKPTKFSNVTFGDSDEARVGDWVIAIGNPFNLGGTVTAGIISARARDINAGPFDDFIQTDAAINRGNSGGPLFDLNGKVVGINSAIFSPSGGNVGIGFSIPSAMAEPIIRQLSQGKEIKRGWLGVKIQTVTEDIADSLGIETDKGALVVEVVKDSPAEKAGFEKGDIILEFDGKEIATMRRLPRIVAETEVSKKVDVLLIRKGKRKTIKVELGQLEDEEKEVPASLSKKKEEESYETAEEILGMKVVAIDESTRAKYRLDDKANGLLIVAVDPSSVAAEKGIRRGDIISEVNQEKADEVDDINDAVRGAKNNKRNSVLLYITRGNEPIFVAIPIK